MTHNSLPQPSEAAPVCGPEDNLERQLRMTEALLAEAALYRDLTKRAEFDDAESLVEDFPMTARRLLEHFGLCKVGSE